MNNAFDIQIGAHPRKHYWYVAKDDSRFLSASYGVEFANSITGTVAIYHFVEMLKSRYPHGQVTFMLPADAGRRGVATVRDAATMQKTRKAKRRLPRTQIESRALHADARARIDASRRSGRRPRRPRGEQGGGSTRSN